jgi:hypothetical protein
MSRIEEQVIAALRDRAAKGEMKYGVTMERNDLSFPQWLQHLQEELMDAAIYIEKCKEEYAKECSKGSCRCKKT